MSMDRHEPDRPRALTRPKAVLFDMDGTLTQPYLDFAAIKAEMGIGNRPILESIAAMPPAERARAEAILHRHEDRAAVESTLNEGCEELLHYLNHLPLPTALVTRNSRKSVETVFRRHGLHFATLITREDGRHHKPHPEPLHRACAALGVREPDAWMVGDGVYDVEAGLAAGVQTVWVSHGEDKPFAAEPLHTVCNLPELTALLRECLR